MNARYVLLLLSTALAVVLTHAAFGRYLGPLSGDLTRIAQLSERDFGWTATQPAIDMRPHETARPDVVVLGDSFSRLNGWQSVASDETGFRFVTYEWVGGLPSQCLRAWLVEAKQRYPTARIVILETVERELINRFGVEGTCRDELRKVRLMRATPDELGGQRPHHLSEILADPVYAWHAWQALGLAFNERVVRNEAVVVPLIRADLFSNRRADRLLYYRRDDLKSEWSIDETSRVASHITELTGVARTLGLQLFFMIVPDKSTIYGPYLGSDPPSESAAWRIGVGHSDVKMIELRQAFGDAVTVHKDFYLSDDTHVGTLGYTVMGHLAARALAQPSN